MWLQALAMAREKLIIAPRKNSFFLLFSPLLLLPHDFWHKINEVKKNIFLKDFMPNQHNQDQIKIIQEKLDKSASIVIIDYSGANVKNLTDLRATLVEAGGEMFVTKNTLIDIAVGKGKLTESLQGMSAVVFSYNDPVSAIKALVKFHDENDLIEIKQGFMDDKVLSIDEVKALSQLPSKNELIVMLIQRLKSPGQGLVNVLQASARNLVYVLKAINDKK